MKRLLMALLLSAALFCSCTPGQAAAPELIESAGMVFDAAAATRMDLKKSNYYQGYVTPYSEGVCYTEGNYIAGESHVKPGDYVKKGDLLFTADLIKLNEGVDAYLEQIAALEEACYDQNMLSSFDAQIAQLEGRAYDAERYQLEIEHRNEKLALDIELVQEKLDILLNQIANYQLFAPMDGVIIACANFNKGNVIERNYEFIYIADESRITVKLFEAMPYLSAGMYPVATGIVNGKEYPLENMGTTEADRMRLYAMGLTPATEYRIIEGAESLAPGDTVEVEINEFMLNDVLCVPINAIFGYGLNAYVYVIEDGEKVFRSVVTGYSSKSYTEITSGLEEGEMVYVRQ